MKTAQRYGLAMFPRAVFPKEVSGSGPAKAKETLSGNVLWEIGARRARKISVPKGARLVLAVSADDLPRTTDAALRLELAEGASCMVYLAASKNALPLRFTLAAELSRGARLLYASFWAGNVLGVERLELALNGRGAAAEAAAFGVAGGGEVFDTRAEFACNARDCAAMFDARSVAAAGGQTLVRAETAVGKSAAGTEARQRFLCLTDGARSVADFEPRLNIMNKDVRCGHAAKTISLSDEELFYMESRGIPRGEARKAAIAAFSEAALGTLPAELQEKARAGLWDTIGKIQP